MRVITVAFGKAKRISVLLQVFLYSLKKNMPEAECTVYYSDLPQKTIDDIKLAFSDYVLSECEITFQKKFAASYKMFLWKKAIDEACDGEFLTLIDSDMLVTSDFSEVFSEEFCIGYTEKDFPSTFKLNTGVVFVKNVNKAKSFFEKWLHVCDRVLKKSEADIDRIEASWGAVDQFALNEVIMSFSEDVKSFPCSVYNLHGQWEL